MMEKQFQIICEGLEEYVRDYIGSVELNLMSARIGSVVKGDGEEKIQREIQIPIYRDWVIQDEELDPILSRAAEWLYESGYGYNLSLKDSDNNPIDNPDRETATIHYKRYLEEFVSKCLQYMWNPTDSMAQIENPSFDVNAYSVAFENEFKPKYGDFGGYLIAPVLGLNLEKGDVFDIPFDVDWFREGYECEKLKSVQLSRITDSDYSSVLTFERGTGGVDLRRLTPWDWTIRIDYSEHAGWERIVDHIVSTLNFQYPRERGVHSPKKYGGSPGVLDYHFGLYDLDRSQSSLERFQAAPELDIERGEEFLEFWEKNGRYFIERDDANPLEKPLRRYHQMYQKTRTEDKILDCWIAFESTLLKDVRGGYGYHFPIRGTLMLHGDDSITSESVYRILDHLYSIRNGIVHNDEEYTPIEISGNTIGNREFIQEIRYILSRILLQYFKADKAGVSVHEWNTEYLMGAIPSIVRALDELPDEYIPDFE